MSEHLFDCTQTLDAALCHEVTTVLADACARRGEATLVVSGGSTPKGLFRKLSTSELPWEKITVLLADERWVPLDHKDCNESMVRQNLLQDKAAQAQFLSLLPAFPERDENLNVVSEALSALPTFDVVILGMGLDAHTASLFPCSDQLKEGLTTTAAALMTEPTTAPHERVSLSRSRLSDCRHGLIHIVGEEKKHVFDRAQAAGNAMTSPIAAFATGESPFSLWYSP
jgi:6-phosphogluconolactonase